MKRREFLITSAIGSSLATSPMVAAAAFRQSEQGSSRSETARGIEGGFRVPLLFFSQADVPKIRRDTTGVKQHIWERIRQAADRDVQLAPLQPDADSEWATRELCTIYRENLVKRCSFAYLITGDEKYRNRARVEVEATLPWDPWIDTSKPNSSKKKYGLMNGTISAMLAFYLDWCGSAVSAKERGTIVDHFRAKAAEPLLRDMERHVAFFGANVNNHIPWMVQGSGLMALLLLDEDPFYADVLEKCVFHLRRYLDWINPDGSTDEGGRYWMLGMRPAAQLLDALRINAHRLPARLQWEQAGVLYRHKSSTSDGSPLQKTGYYALYCIQRRRWVVDFGDTPAMDAFPMQSLFYWLARIWRNGHYQWQGNQVAALGRGADRSRLTSSDTSSSPHQTTDPDPMSCLWYDPTISAKAPDDLTPSKAFHGAGWGILRSDLTDPDGFLLAIRAGDNRKSHRHFDLGTFILRSFGRGLIVDSGLPQYSAAYWSGKENYRRSTMGHNCILVDGKGQKNGARNKAEITRLQDFGDTKYLAVDVHCPSNGIELHRRQFAVDITDPHRIGLRLEDDVQLVRNAEVMWLFHFEGDAQVQGDVISIFAGPTQLRLRISSSASFKASVERDYPVPFVSIKTDTRKKAFTLSLEGDIQRTQSGISVRSEE